MAVKEPRSFADYNKDKRDIQKAYDTRVWREIEYVTDLTDIVGNIVKKEF